MKHCLKTAWGGVRGQHQEVCEQNPQDQSRTKGTGKSKAAGSLAPFSGWWEIFPDVKRPRVLRAGHTLPHTMRTYFAGDHK